MIDSEDLAGGFGMIFGNFSPQEFILIFLVALILFGPKKLPEIGRTVGKALTEFRRASNELKATFDREMRNMEAETGIKDVVNQYRYDTYRSDYTANDARYDPVYAPPSIEPAPGFSTAEASAPDGGGLPVLAAPEGAVAHLSGSADGAVSAHPAATASAEDLPSPASANTERPA
jgi:TatA/E family protein of Tat protein translocase